MDSLLITTGVKFQDAQNGLLRKQVLRLGRWIHPSNATKFFEVTSDFVDKIIANFKAKVDGDKIPVFLEADAHKADPANNKGYGIDLVKENDGLYAVLQFSDEATKAKAVKNEIPGISAGIVENYKRTDTGQEVGPVITHFSLVSFPYIKNLRGFEPVALANRQFEVFLSEGTTMAMTKEELIAKAKELNVDIIALEKAKIDLVTQTQEVTRLTTAAGGPNEITKLTSRLTTAEAALVAKTGEVTALSTKVDEMEKAGKQKDAETKVDGLIGQGKVKPADRDIYLKLAQDNPTLFVDLTKNLTVIVPLDERGVTSVTGTAKLSDVQVQAEVDRICKEHKVGVQK